MAKIKAKPNDSSLLNALSFISLAQTNNSDIAYQKHCCIQNGMITATNGILSTGHKIEEDLDACPHTYSLLNALSKCGQTLSITQLENSKLSIKSGKFSAFVDCLDIPLPNISPDASCAVISDDLKLAMGKVSHLAVDAGKTVLESAVLLKSMTTAATSGFVILEAWHGIDLPTCVLPKVFVSAVCNNDKKLKGFGFSVSSVTFWFEDESWIKTQVYAEQFPDISGILNVTLPETKPLTAGFFDAIRTIEDFAENGREKGCVYFTDKGMRSKKAEGEGAFYEIEGLPVGYNFKIRQLKQVEDVCIKVAFDRGMLFCFSDGVRGVVQGVR